MNSGSYSIAAYRPDIDGMRAIAVLSVILFHIKQNVLPGGFVGVDIFFVISGFLISRNILSDINEQRFSIFDFYRRRIKRIAPVLLVVVFATLMVSQTLMIPEDAERAADSALWSLLSLSNVYFYLFRDLSYFAADSKELPFLHLWSLGVEEQFYLIWPILLLALYRPVRWRVFAAIGIVVAAASYSLGELIFDRAPLFAYYMLPTRAGELLIGSLVAIAALRGLANTIPKIAVFPMAAMGLLLVLGSFVFMSENDAFPGLRALPPTIGASLLIWAGLCGENSVSRLLAVKPLVWIGLVSYSAYLWHWPILAFLRYGYGNITLQMGVAVVCATFSLAWVSYCFVERPARARNWSFRKVVSLQYVVPAGTLSVMCLGAMFYDGYGARYFAGEYKTELQVIRRETEPAFYFNYVCQKQRISEEDTHDPRCVIGTNISKRPNVLLWGDSNAAHYIGIIGSFANQAGFAFRNIEAGSCPAIDGDPRPFVPPQRLLDCRKSLEVIRRVVDHYPIIIMSSNWLGYDGGSEDFLERSTATAQRLAQEGKLVILLGKVPVLRAYDRRCREKALSYPGLDCRVPATGVAADVLRVNNVLRTFAEKTRNVEFFEITKTLCPHGTCSSVDDEGNPLYFDSVHLSMKGSWRIGQMILKQDGLPPPFAMIQNFGNSAEHKER